MKDPRFVPRLDVDAILKAGIYVQKCAAPESPKKGFVLHIVRFGKKPSLESICFGDPGPRIAEFNFYASEKINRLNQRRNGDYGGEVASSESMNVAALQYAGAIVALDTDGDEVYLAVSGLDQFADEALAYCIAGELELGLPSTYKNNWIEEVRYSLWGD